MLSGRPFATLFSRARGQIYHVARLGPGIPLLDPQEYLIITWDTGTFSARKRSPQRSKASTLIRPLLLSGSSTAQCTSQKHDPTNHITTCRKPDIRLLTRPTISQPQRPQCSALTILQPSPEPPQTLPPTSRAAPHIKLRKTPQPPSSSLSSRVRESKSLGP